MNCTELADTLNRGEDSQASGLILADELETEATISEFDEDFSGVDTRNFIEKNSKSWICLRSNCLPT